MPSIPLLNERVYAPYKIAALVEVMAEQGVSAAAILAGCDIAPEEIYDASIMTSVRQYAAACKNAIELSHDPAIPFKTGSRLHLSAYGMYGYALMSCLSLRDYFKLGVKYHRLATPTLTIEWKEYPDRAVWSFPDAFISSPSRELGAFVIEQQFTQHVTHLQDVAGRSCPPILAHFPYPAPAHAALYQEYLGCECLFSQQECQLIYDSAILDQEPQLAHKLTSKLLQDMCDRLIGQSKISTGISGEVYQVLMSKPGHYPNMEGVARVLKMTSRTLRRRLDDEGTTFSAIADDVLSSLAQEYLRTTQMSTDDIAMLLGFSDGASFRRALRRWTGKGAADLR